MKKLFVSVPMRGRTKENIRASIEKMHKIAEVIFGEDLEVIPSYIDDDPPKTSKEAVWHLGKSIELASTADYFIGTYSYLNGVHYFGCEVEGSIADKYNIPFIFINETAAKYIMPDLFENKDIAARPANRLDAN